MKAEIISIGTELLLGQILNSNTHWLSNELNKLGIDCYYHTTVGDNPSRIKDIIKAAIERSDLIITTGGLGPTPDDLTVETLAEYFNEEMILCTESLDHIKEFFRKRNRQMVPSNEKQALYPKTASILPNPVGTAPGIIWDVSPYTESETSIYIMTFPGVPSEMKAMWLETAQPFLLQQSSSHLTIKELKFFGIGESNLAEQVIEHLNSPNPTVAPLAGKNECRLRITAKSESPQKNIQMIEDMENQIREKVGEYIYGINDDTLESVTTQLLKDQNLTIAVAESCTGGLISQRLTSLPGSSKFFMGGVTAYSNKSKEILLDISSEILQAYGAVSSQVAEAMAQNIQKIHNTNIGVGITGIAGPTSDNTQKPIGLVYVSICIEDSIYTHEFNFGSQKRDSITWQTSQECLNLIRKLIQTK